MEGIAGKIENFANRLEDNGNPSQENMPERGLKPGIGL
jgi:hypothetical protein